MILYPAFGVSIVGYYGYGALTRDHRPHHTTPNFVASPIEKRYLKKNDFSNAPVNWRHHMKGPMLVPPPPPPPRPVSYSSGSYSSGSGSSFSSGGFGK